MGSAPLSLDLLWIPARLELESEAGDVFLPALYLVQPRELRGAPPARQADRLDWRMRTGPTLGIGLRRSSSWATTRSGILEWGAIWSSTRSRRPRPKEIDRPDRRGRDRLGIC